ncbi:GH25 family lysozyme [Sphingomonas sp.]|uniref:GH25 family lysozyme n=1 Tax=Sphingomonas sp. TaxID=28214 RepID=UPI0025875734|nr:GH25 family lysozyme [Sphingomonas sp.]
MAYAFLKGVGALIAAGAIAIAGWSYATAWHPSAERYPLQGIDLDRNPRPIEWGMVRARGADFAYLVATDGADVRDAAFEWNWSALPEAGLRRGAVHLYSFCQPAVAQANAFNAFVPRAADALPPAVDISFRDDCPDRPERAKAVAELTRFIAMVETHMRKPVLLRVAKPVERAYQISDAIDRPLWAIGNILAPSYATRPWRMWRSSDFRRIDGIEGPVNWDVVAS